MSETSTTGAVPELPPTSSIDMLVQGQDRPRNLRAPAEDDSGAVHIAPLPPAWPP